MSLPELLRLFSPEAAAAAPAGAAALAAGNGGSFNIHSFKYLCFCCVRVQAILVFRVQFKEHNLIERFKIFIAFSIFQDGSQSSLKLRS